MDDRLKQTGDDEERIENTAQILRRFERLAELRSFVSIRVEDGLQQVTVILDVNSKDNSVIVDAPADPSVDALLRPGAEVHLSAQLSGIGIRATTKVRDRVRFEGSSAIRLERPAMLRFLQRRARFRARIPMSMQPTIELHARDQEGPVIGRVVDVSALGLGVEIDSSTHNIEDWSRGDTVLLYSGLVLPEQVNPLSGSARIANVRDGTRSKHVGLSLVDVDDATEQVLTAAAFYFEREELRLR
ncbi:MAG: flagellar brake protein [Thioalkalivibrionaceae bacterium]